MKLDESSELNSNVIRYLAQHKKNQPSIAPPSSVPDPYYKQGSHPDVVEYLWDKLGASLPKDSRCLLYGVPALVHPNSGIVLAFAGGTVYYLRLSMKTIDEAIKLGFRTRITWTYDGELDTRQEFGPDWVLGGWSPKELEWCRIVYDELNIISK